MTVDQLEPVLDVHLRGAFFVTQPAWSVMQDKGYGRVVLTSSSAGAFGREAGANYVASKAAMLGLGRALALEGAEHGILANCILPIAPFGRRGPVEPTRAWILTAKADLDPEALEVLSGVYLSASPALVRRTLEAAPDPSVRMVVGYAGWGAGQLEDELAGSSWLMAPVESDLIFSTPVDDMWETAIRRLGAEPSMLQGSSGVH
jgi:NAD(P)-dependent dehydrogenase (short-subunit alcohol dehydrogenase family)